MIDFRVSEHPDMITEISASDLLDKFKGKANLDLINFLIENQNDLEITYSKNKDKYRFDNVSISDLIFNLTIEDKTLSFMENFQDSFKVNIDIDMKNNKIVFLHMIEPISVVFDLNIPESSKLEQVKVFKAMQSSLNKLGFTLEEYEESHRLALVHSDLQLINLVDLSKALIITESYTPCHEGMF